MIKLFEANEQKFLNNGLGGLNDAGSCVVTEELNGGYELVMVYPINGIHYSEIALKRIILAKPNIFSCEQPFRIYSISKPINGLVTINAEHISYDLTGIPVNPVSPFYVDGVENVFTYLKTNAAVTCPFNFITDMTGGGEMDITVPRSIRSMLGSEDNSVLSLYGGEYEFDVYAVILHNARGENRGTTIWYGKNMTDLKQEENCANVYTGVYPYYYVEDDGFQHLDERIIYADGTYDFTKIMPLDLTSNFSEMPTQDQLRTAATQYMTDNNIGVPEVSLSVSFISVIQNGQASQFENVRLGDTITVEFPKLGVNTTAECIKTEYDAINGQYNSIELGQPIANIADTIVTTMNASTSASSAVKNVNASLGTYLVRKITKETQDDATQVLTDISIDASGGILAKYTTMGNLKTLLT